MGDCHEWRASGGPAESSTLQSEFECDLANATGCTSAYPFDSFGNFGTVGGGEGPLFLDVLLVRHAMLAMKILLFVSGDGTYKVLRVLPHNDQVDRNCGTFDRLDWADIGI